jgi:Cu(I)/Ag(I) efflux system membrane fusion protein
MALVRAEDLGYMSTNKFAKEPPLVIPATAPLITGKRAVVYIQIPGRNGVYEGREVVLGPRAGEYYIVKEGLEEGDLVVVHGNFKIDSAIQILAKPSMMNPGRGAAGSERQHSKGAKTSNPLSRQRLSGKDNLHVNVSDKFLKQLDSIYSEYFSIHTFLSQDQLAKAKQAAKKLENNLDLIDHHLLNTKMHDLWMPYYKSIRENSINMKSATTLDAYRESFESLSKTIIAVTKSFGGNIKKPVYIYHCPMAFDNKGADWLQNTEGVENPYFGSKMFTCGNLKEKIMKVEAVTGGGHVDE